ncbi:uncharacterized protein FIESC28_02496 [Fusarium coffeatum]|uniref:Uncharacterized protein n=1 Tax=Fusarium coffeatum TaxID=231269 RepID=A0A366S5X2_9HYPO|nr:uncharacterized protein FIESC28_02496 [Fusarium coffeatum]RBR24723.1 hypothetical protein FIESC28_02496 [Fusarium coffeatum]
MKFLSVAFALFSASVAMAAVLPEPEIPGKLVTREEFELAIRQAGCSACVQVPVAGKT